MFYPLAFVGSVVVVFVVVALMYLPDTLPAAPKEDAAPLMVEMTPMGVTDSSRA